MYGTNPNQLSLGVMNLYFKRAGDTKYYDIGSIRDSAFAYGVEVKEHASVLPSSTVMARDKVVVISKSCAVRGTAEQLNTDNLRLVMGGATVTGGTIPVSGGGVAIANVSGGWIALGETTAVEEVEVIGVHRFPDGYFLNLRFWACNAAGAFELPFNQTDWVGYPVELKALAKYNLHPEAPFGFLEVSSTAAITGSGMVY
jgi:hypothetical protein